MPAFPPPPAPDRRAVRSRARLLAILALPALCLLCAAAAFATKDPAGPYKKLDVFSHVLSLIENNYVEPVDESRLIYGAIDGMVRTLDPHTNFMDPRSYAGLKVETDGEYGGVGLELANKGDDVIVISPLQDTPAARAGIMSGDRMIEVDGVSTHGLREPDVTRALNGPPGTRCVVKTLRDGWSEPKTFSMVRDVIRIVSVDEKLFDKRLGYVRIKSFQDRTDAYLKRSLEVLRAQGGGELKGLVLDLRQNPGGLLDQAVRVADRFMEGGVIVTTKGRGGRHVEVERAHTKETEPDYPMVVLVDGGTASASEIVAGALQDSGRAAVLGTQTFGKGSVQTVIELEDGSGLKLTIARYYTPSGRSIQEKGITPDLVVKGLSEDESMREKSLPGHFKGEDDKADKKPEGAPDKDKPAAVASATQPGDPGDDPQLKAALETLRNWQNFRAQKAARTGTP
ncbi:MAG: S41 family peptidase [Deltaproteobacteria bacterium]|nr:S41 family peptidase [Deltaproteobacteria bacterium]